MLRGVGLNLHVGEIHMKRRFCNSRSPSYEPIYLIFILILRHPIFVHFDGLQFIMGHWWGDNIA